MGVWACTGDRGVCETIAPEAGVSASLLDKLISSGHMAAQMAQTLLVSNPEVLLGGPSTAVLARPARIERATPGFGGQYSIH